MQQLHPTLLGRKHHPPFRLKLAALVALIVVAVPSLAYAAPSPHPAHDETYVVTEGDTLLGIAIRYDVELDDLVASNGIENPNFLSLGQQLTIPTSAAPLSAHLSVRATRPSLAVPAPGGISTYFDERGWYWRLGWHTGIDFAATYGDTVQAALDGVVIESEDGDNRGYGNYIKIDHGNGLHTLYAHLAERYASVGEWVQRGEPIGAVGDSGFAFGPHLHFEVRQNGEFRDPLTYLP